MHILPYIIPPLTFYHVSVIFSQNRHLPLPPLLPLPPQVRVMTIAKGSRYYRPRPRHHHSSQRIPVRYSMHPIYHPQYHYYSHHTHSIGSIHHISTSANNHTSPYTITSYHTPPHDYLYLQLYP